MHKFLSLALIIALIAAPALAQQAAAPAQIPKPQTLAELQARIVALLDDPKFVSMRWGALIKTDQGKIIFERDADKAFTPASNMKLYTSAAVLDAFGPDYKIKTSVYAAKPAKKGVIAGDVILYGRGDPNLSARFDAENPDKFGDFYPADKIAAIEQLADQLKAAGVKIITGNLIGNESYFAGDALGTGWEWDDLQFYYGAPISALTVNDNAITYVVTPGKRVGDAPVIRTRPATAFPTIINHAKTSAAIAVNGRTRIGVHRSLDRDTLEFFGTIPRNASDFEVEIAVQSPAAFAATLFKEALQRRGIKIRGKAKALNAIDRVGNPFDMNKLTELTFVESQPMATLLKVVNKPSQNLHTEIMLRQLGVANTSHELDEYGRPKPTFERANEARKQFLTKAGVNIAPLSLRDGSGLSRSDLVTPRATSQLLEFMRTHQQATVFRESLPVAGFDGTLKRRMKGTAAEGNLRAKTGTLTYVNALSGYLTTANGQTLIVSFYGNNYVGAGREVTGTLDQLCALLAEYAGEW